MGRPKRMTTVKLPLVLKSNKSDRNYIVTEELRNRKGEVMWYVTDPKNSMLDGWKEKDTILKMATPAWEWDDDLLQQVSYVYYQLARVKKEYDAIPAILRELDSLMTYIHDLRKETQLFNETKGGNQ